MAGTATYFNTLKVKKSLYGLKISGVADKIIAEIKLHTTAKGYINLEIKERRDVGQFGDTHNIVVDMWEPDHSKAAPALKPDLIAQEDLNTTHDDLPF